MAREKQVKDISGRENKLVAKVRDYKQVFGSQAGERVLHDLILSSGMLDDEFRSTEQTQFNSGQRNIVKMILKNMHASISDLLAHIEAIEARKRAGR